MTEYQWTFSITDVIKFEETEITVFADTYENAIRKIRGLKLPQLRTYTSVEEGMKLTQVYEVREDVIEEDEDFVPEEN